jgi:hypothetical protein
VSGRLRVLLLAERDRALDEDRLLADVAPLERQRFAGPESGVRQDADQRRVARRACRAHPFDRRRSQRPDLSPSRKRSLADGTRRVRLDLPVLERALDLLGVALTQILQTPGVPELLLAKADHGVRIRILVRRPRPELQPLLGHDNIAIRVLAQPGNVIHRFDEQLLLITKFHGEDNDKPHAMLHFRRAAPDGFFDRLTAAFDSLWLHAAPAGTDARAELERAPADSAVEPTPTVPATSQASPTSARHWPRRPT